MRLIKTLRAFVSFLPTYFMIQFWVNLEKRKMLISFLFIEAGDSLFYKYCFRCCVHVVKKTLDFAVSRRAAVAKTHTTVKRLKIVVHFKCRSSTTLAACFMCSTNFSPLLSKQHSFLHSVLKHFTKCLNF